MHRADTSFIGDPLLRELASTVVSCTQEPIEHSGPTSNRKKKAPANGSASKGKILGVVLHDTVLFPEGGGQPSDIGILRTTEGEQHEVVEVKRHGGHAVHYVKTNSKEGEMKGLEVGASVTTALGEVGYARRLDHVRLCSARKKPIFSASDFQIIVDILVDVYAYFSTRFISPP